MIKPVKTNEPRKFQLKRDTRDNIDYWLYLLPWFAAMIVFMYIPMVGNIIAFQNYKGGNFLDFSRNKFVGLKWFEEFVTSYYFKRILRNTVWINLIGLFMGFWVPIAFALLLNEIRFSKVRKTIQTISYMPHFISAVVVASMFLGYISDNGLIPKFCALLGFEVKGLGSNQAFYPWYYTFIGVWKGFGWSSILYLSTITAIDPGLYEAAELDGANRIQKIWHITLPQMKPLIVIQLIFAIGGLLGSNTEFMLLMYNPTVYETTDIIGTYLYRDGLLGGRFSYGQACSIILSLMGFALTWGANKCSAKFADFSLW